MASFATEFISGLFLRLDHDRGVFASGSIANGFGPRFVEVSRTTANDFWPGILVGIRIMDGS